MATKFGGFDSRSERCNLIESQPAHLTNLARLGLEQGKDETLSPIPHYNEPRAEFFWLLF